MTHAAHPTLVEIYDTTLRDGTQREGLSLSCEDKLRIARRLDALGVAFIEGGWPGSNPKDAELFERAKDLPWEHAALTAFGSTLRAGMLPEKDPGLAALIAAGTRVVTIFGKTSPLHVNEVLRTTLDENLRLIAQSVAYLRAHGLRVIYDAEHFFDGFGEDASYATATLLAAHCAGAETLVLCDTNGGSLPWRVEEIVGSLASLKARLGVHCHDDSGCGVANTLAAVRAGARQVQGTVNGYGERCGNANLCAVIPGLELKLGLRCLPEGALTSLCEVSRFVAEVANTQPDEHMAYVGRSAFAHKGGVHVAAMRRNPRSYQHIEPSRVGNVSRVVISELAGKATVADKAEQFQIPIAAGAEQRVLERIKRDEAAGFSFEAAEASVALLLRRDRPGYQPPFRLLEYKVMAGQRDARGFCEAVVKIAIGAADEHLTAAEGNGPVSALDAALRKALLPLFPRLRDIQLSDYKVRILDGGLGTSAITRVLIDSTDGVHRWSTVGASPSILSASSQALVDSLEFGLTLAEASPPKHTQQPQEVAP